MKPTKTAATRHDFDKFVRDAAPGAICLYHVGELALDRETNAKLGNHTHGRASSRSGRFFVL